MPPVPTATSPVRNRPRVPRGPRSAPTGRYGRLRRGASAGIPERTRLDALASAAVLPVRRHRSTTDTAPSTLLAPLAHSIGLALRAAGRSVRHGCAAIAARVSTWRAHATERTHVLDER